MLTEEADQYFVQLIDSPAGQASHHFTLPFSLIELENFILKTGQNRGNVRSLYLETIDFQSIEKLGGDLYNCLFDGKVAESLRTSQAIARRERKGLRIRLRLSAAPTLINIPWELLFDTEKNNYVGLSVNSPIIRKLDLTTSPRIDPVQGTVKILIMIANPSDNHFPFLDAAEELKKINIATGELQNAGRITLTPVEPSLAALQRQLRLDSYHVFHYIGHGGFDPSLNDGLLILEDSEGKSHKVSGQYLGSILYDHHSIKLALLNSCSGGRTSVTDPFAGLAQSLLQKDIPAVIAMQFEITDQAAITFSQEFYNAVADGYPIDAAVSEARKMIYAQANQLEWATPVLYTSIDGGVLLEKKLLKQPKKEFNQASVLDVSKEKDTEKPSPHKHFNIIIPALLVALMGFAVYKFTKLDYPAGTSASVPTPYIPSLNTPPITKVFEDNQPSTLNSEKLSNSPQTGFRLAQKEVQPNVVTKLAKVAFTIDHIHDGNHWVMSTYDQVKNLVEKNIPVTVFLQATDPSDNYNNDKTNAKKIYDISPKLVTLGIHTLPRTASEKQQTENITTLREIIHDVTGTPPSVLSYHGPGAASDPNINLQLQDIRFARGIMSVWGASSGNPLDTPVITLKSVNRAFASIHERHSAGLSSTLFVHSAELTAGSTKKAIFDALIEAVLQGRLQAISYLKAMQNDFGESETNTDKQSLQLSAVTRGDRKPINVNFHIKNIDNGKEYEAKNTSTKIFAIPFGKYKITAAVGNAKVSSGIILESFGARHHLFLMP